jgi:hypothetical protein
MLSPVREEGHAELLRELLLPIDRRRDELQRQLDELAVRRPLMPLRERTAAREAAVELRDELARLELVAAVATRLLRPPVRASRSRRGTFAKRRETRLDLLKLDNTFPAARWSPSP